MIEKIKKGSMWLALLEQLVYFCPTMATVLYYYFANIRQSVSWTSQFSFAIAITLFVLFLILKKVAKTKIDELRLKTVQTETDLLNTPDSEVDRRVLLADNAKTQRKKLDAIDRVNVIIVLLIIALAVHILERALIGLSMLAYIALGSVACGFGLHMGVLELKARESIKRGVENEKKKRH